MKPGDSSLTYDQLPKVQIGGSEDGPQFFSSVETFLEALPDNYSYHLMLDQMTRITNKPDLDRLQEKFGERFVLTDIEELGAQLIEKFPQYKEVLTDVTQNATGGMPVITSDIYRLIAMPYADKRNLDVTQKTRYLYLDIDTFVRGLSESKTLPFWLSKHYKTRSKDVTLYIPKYWDPGDSELKSTDFFNPLAGDKPHNALIGIEFPFQGQKQYETFVCHVLDNLKDLNYSGRDKFNIVKFPLKLYKNLLAGNNMTFMDDPFKMILSLDVINFMNCIIDRTGSGLLFKICESHAEKFRVLQGPDRSVCAMSWCPEDVAAIFSRGYIEKAWSNRGIPTVEEFLAQPLEDPLIIGSWQKLFDKEKTGKCPENTTRMSTRNGTSSKPSSENANTSGGSSRVSTKFFGKRKHFRRVFARFDKIKDAYAAFIAIPSTIIGLR
jgi:hypothetical protein